MSNYRSTLHDENTFYRAFLRDLDQATEEIIIESPFITSSRMKMLWPSLRRAYSRGIKIYIITRDPNDHSDGYEVQSENEIEAFESLGIQVLLCTGNHHRKLAIIDREILWEGSLNILSQIKSREIMRRFDGGGFAVDMFNFLNFGRYI
jgi:phosphatidylserine/phosphatidylglycerophosphate/cardiolipin synthase-like enzyme